MPLRFCRWYAIISATPETAQHLKTMTAIHTLTNGIENYQFEIAGDIATLTTINAAIGRNGGLVSKEEITTAEARKMWAYGLKHGCTEGWTEATIADPEAPLCVD